MANYIADMNGPHAETLIHDITDQIKATEMMREALLVDFNSLNQSKVFENFTLSTGELINKIYAKAISNSMRYMRHISPKSRLVAVLL